MSQYENVADGRSKLFTRLGYGGASAYKDKAIKYKYVS